MRPRISIPRQCWHRQATLRLYSVRVPSEPRHVIRNVADLKSWQPSRGTASDVEVTGWVRSIRRAAAVRFVDVVDGSCMRPVQAVVEKGLASDIRVGAAISLKGTWHSTTELQSQQPTEGVEVLSGEAADIALNHGELRVEQLEILGPSNPSTNPIQHKYQSPESLRFIPHLRSRTPVNSTLLRLRSDATAVLTQFFYQEKFQQCHPPLITSSDCEGAGETFNVLDGELTDLPERLKRNNGKLEHFFKSPKYLTVSSQFHLEAMAQALGNVWCLSPTFRAEHSDTSRHLSEFYMLEAEMSFVNELDDVMDLAQNMMRALAEGLKQSSLAAQELEQNRLDSKDPAEREAFADLESPEELRRRWEGLVVPERWPRITYTDAIQLLSEATAEFQHPPVWGSGLQSEHEQWLARKLGFNQERNLYMPLFITHYPQGIKAFYMRGSTSSPAQGQTVDCFDLVVPSLGELAGGSMREHRLEPLQKNMKQHGLATGANEKSLSWYVDLRRWGSPPHGGFGLGFDRLLGYLTGVQSVRDVVPFPRHYQRCDC